jgi:uncharacterized DUF497 family protein
MDFQWDEDKRRYNLEKHGVDFWDVTRIFENPLVLNYSPRGDEIRFVAIGRLIPPESVPNQWSGPLVAVVYTIRDGEIRIISARRASTNERKQYRSRIS